MKRFDQEERSGGVWMRFLREHPEGIVFDEAPCRCGAITRGRAITSITYFGHDRHGDIERVVQCAACATKRHRAQAEQIAANEAVFPHVREEARQFLAETAKAA